MWADNSGLDFTSTGENEFSVRATGGARIVTGITPQGGALAGVSVAAGGGSWSSLSDENAKENFRAVDVREVLERVTALPITTWNYKAQPASQRHIGPTAQGFAAAFGVGEDARRISSVDADGVALAAIQGLRQLVGEQAEALRGRDERIAALEKALAELRRVVDGLRASQPNGKP